MIEQFIGHIENKNNEYIIFDVGSRDCMQAIEFYNNFPNAKIFAFECNPNTLDICKQNIKDYSDRITLVEGAVCNYDGNITFYPINQQKTITSWKDGNPGASSLFKSNGKYPYETYVQDEITVNCHRLDTIMKRYDIPRVDIIWMDLQGAELLALKGLGNNLHNVKYIHTEACFKEMYDKQSLFPEINNYLCNFFCFDLLTTNIDETTFFSDVIYKNRFLDDQIFNKINLSYHEQTNVRGKPKNYLLHTIKLFKNFTNAKTILEIGSIRSKMLHDITQFNPDCCNDGHSTYFWKHYTDADIYTIDIDPNCKLYIDNDIRLHGVYSNCIDAFTFASTFNKQIDLLYLDAWDHNSNDNLNFYNQIKTKLSKSCIIVIDDSDINNGNNNNSLNPQLIKDGFVMITNKRQTIFIKTILSNTIETQSNELFDVIISVGPNDKDIIYKQIEYTKRNIIGKRNIYLICYDPSINIEGCITIDEKIFPFTIDTVSRIHGKSDRNGWYLQQLLKLYAGNIIPGILGKYLVIDSDTFFLKPTTFIENDKCLYNFGTEYHPPYFEHMNKLDKELIRMDRYKSGICHHMIFETKYINELMNRIEEYHNDYFYNVFLNLVSKDHVQKAGASEFEIYFNYMQKYHNDKITIRPLKWKNVFTLNTDSDFDYISYHWFDR